VLPTSRKHAGRDSVNSEQAGTDQRDHISFPAIYQHTNIPLPPVISSSALKTPRIRNPYVQGSERVSTQPKPLLISRSGPRGITRAQEAEQSTRRPPSPCPIPRCPGWSSSSAPGTGTPRCATISGNRQSDDTQKISRKYRRLFSRKQRRMFGTFDLLMSVVVSYCNKQTNTQTHRKREREKCISFPRGPGRWYFSPSQYACHQFRCLNKLTRTNRRA
jgi:hypothetical protein